MVLPNVLVNIGIGGVAGAAGALAVYPIDLVKTRLQSSAGAAYTNGFHVAALLWETEGPISFYKGVGPQLTGVAPEKTIKLVVNDAVRGLWAAGSNGVVPLGGEIAAGACAGLCQVIVTNPLEIVKVRLQLDGGRRSWLSVVQELGLPGLYTGAAACACRDSVFSAILFPTYAHTKPLVESALAEPSVAVVCFVAGALAAAPAAILTTPLDVIKTRQQQGSGGLRIAAASHDSVLPLPRTYNAQPDPDAPPSLSGTLSQLIEDEGAGALFHGCVERVLRSSPQFGVTLAVFELLKTVHDVAPTAGQG